MPLCSLPQNHMPYRSSEMALSLVIWRQETWPRLVLTPLLHIQMAPLPGITQSYRFRGYKHAQNIRKRGFKSHFSKSNKKLWVRACSCHTVLLYASFYPILFIMSAYCSCPSEAMNKSESSNQMRLLEEKKNVKNEVKKTQRVLRSKKNKNVSEK